MRSRPKYNYTAQGTFTNPNIGKEIDKHYPVLLIQPKANSISLKA